MESSTSTFTIDIRRLRVLRSPCIAPVVTALRAIARERACSSAAARALRRVKAR